ncbi:hypothetical protein [Curtobacterium flaccumfaciens]|uniref:hypothetical protein n=1 Tax=Curtobacterium flaccumfaciens TaxID=2035 RepID=UPI001ADAFB56|nr:hypothetical protein [Curtobacterium flaccumfaciens]MBO9043492.1 hypothetical protein [Curtobacterium flaccumfaciens pv. flaccumfaciens]
MSAWEPTPAERRKYRDYTVEFVESQSSSVRSEVLDGNVLRFICRVRRFPSDKKFVVIVYKGVSDSERARIELWGNGMPLGGWAMHPTLWFRHTGKTSKKVYFVQECGYPAPDPFAQLELELMIDADSEVTV